MSEETASLAMTRITALMNLTRVEDLNEARRIIGEQQRIIQAAGFIQEGRIIGNESQIPRSTTFPLDVTEPYRYTVIVDVLNGMTGDTVSIPIDIFSDVPMLRDDVLNRAAEKAMSEDIVASDGKTLGEGYQRLVTRTVIISASRR
jgi:hypothetical protein